MIRLEGETLPDESKGQIVPYIIGKMKAVPGIPIQVGFQDKLATAIPASGSISAIVLSTTDIVERLPSSGKMQIDSERFGYTGKNISTLSLTGITRAIDGTSQAAHTIDSPVYQFIQFHIYCFGENPSGHLTKSVTNVSINDRALGASGPPTYTVQLQNTTMITGKNVVTVTFDVSTLPFTTTTISTVHTLAEQPVTPPPTGTWWGASGGGGGDQFSGFPPPTTYSQKPKTWTTRRTVREYPVPLLGTVTADIEGLQDTVGGVISGTPSLLLENPTHVTRLLMREVWLETSAALYDDPVWTTTKTEQDNDGLKWACRFLPLPFSQFRELVGLQGRADLYREDGKWRYRYRQRPSSITYTLDKRAAIGVPTMHWTPSTALTTVLSVTYGADITSNAFTLESTTGKARFGVQHARNLDLPWIITETKARQLGVYWLSQWDKPRLSLTSRAPWEAILLDKTDLVEFDMPIMDAIGQRRIQFEVRGKHYLLDDALLDLTLIETDPAAISLRSGYTVSAAIRGLDLPTGYEVATNVPEVNDLIAIAFIETALVAVGWTKSDSMSIGLTDSAVKTISSSLVGEAWSFYKPAEVMSLNG